MLPVTLNGRTFGLAMEGLLGSPLHLGRAGQAGVEVDGTTVSVPDPIAAVVKRVGREVGRET